MSTAMKISVGAAIAILILAVVGVVWGVTTHTEPGLMRACWRFTTVDSYDCDEGEDLVWDRDEIPLSVSADGLIGETQTAIDLINSQVGCDILEFAEASRIGTDVTIISDSPMSPGTGRGGATWHVRGSDGMRARVELYAPGALAERVIVHELGHVLGLAHDEHTGSIMYPTQTDTRDLQFILITQHDRSLLRDLYCAE